MSIWREKKSHLGFFYSVVCIQVAGGGVVLFEGCGACLSLTRVPSIQRHLAAPCFSRDRRKCKDGS